MKTTQLKIIPKTIADIQKMYELTEDELPMAYTSYLMSNSNIHHYGEFNSANQWFTDQMEKYPWTSPEMVVQSWLSNGWSEGQVAAYAGNDDYIEALMEVGFDANSTMHHDDPSLIELHAELDEILSILQK